MNSAKMSLYPLSSAAVEALQNDLHLKKLYKRLSEIHSKVLPVITEVSSTEFKISYSNEVNDLIDKIHKEINFRQEQILSSYKNR